MRIHEHHLFSLLNGNPQSIILTAPVLADTERCIDLPELYKMLTSDRIFHKLKDVEDNKKALAPLRLSASVSIQHILETDGDSLDLLFLLSLIPGGITWTALNKLWKKLKLTRDSGYSDTKTVTGRSHLHIEGDDDDPLPNTGHSDLRRAFNDLYRSKIASLT